MSMKWRATGLAVGLSVVVANVGYTAQPTQNANISGKQAWGQLTCNLPGPPGRSDASAVFDPESARLIIFGGTNTSSCTTNRNDVWWLSPSRGTHLKCVEAQPTGAPPAPRSGHSS